MTVRSSEGPGLATHFNSKSCAGRGEVSDVECHNSVSSPEDRSFQDHLVVWIPELRLPGSVSHHRIPESHKISSNSLTSLLESPDSFNCSGRVSTASYSSTSGVESTKSNCASKAAVNIARDAPCSLRSAATSMQVSNTSRAHHHITCNINMSSTCSGLLLHLARL